MTDIELLPLPSVLLNWPHPTNHVAIRDYARANVAHATAAKDAEIEALRAEVLRLRTDNSESFRDAAILANIRRDEAEARVERLAEALRWYAEQAELCRKLGAAGDSGRRALDADGGKRARAALRNHDQEVGNG